MRIVLLNILRTICRLLDRVTPEGRGTGLIYRVNDLLAPELPIVAQVDQARMLLDLKETYNRFLFYRGVSTIEEFRPYCGSIKPGMTVLDVGANVGVFTLAAARLTGPSGKVISFEPLPRNQHFLMANLALNGYNNVEIVPQAVTDYDGVLDINLFGTDSLSMSDTIAQGKGRHTLSVPCCRLDTYLSAQGVDRVDVMKIDVEGAEGMVLEGMQGYLDGSNYLPLLILEVHPDFMESLGYSAEDLLEQVVGKGYSLTNIVNAPGRNFGNIPIESIKDFDLPYDERIKPHNRFRVMARPG